jgi:O-antigen/teichoic acid export membrane protein
MIWSQAKSLLQREHVQFFLSNLAQQALAFLTVLAVAKILPENEFAHVRIAQAYLAVLLIVGAAGVTAPILRYSADANPSSLEKRRLFGHGLKIAMLASAALMATAFAVVFARYPADSVERLVFLGYAAQIPAVVALSISLVYLQGLQRFRQLAASQFLLKAIALPCLVGGAYLFGVSGFVVAALAMAIFSALVMLMSAPPAMARRRPNFLPSDFNSLARYSVIGTMLSTLGQSSDLILLDVLHVDKNAIGSYSLATVFLVAASALVGTAQSVATPAFTQLMNDPARFRQKLFAWSSGMFLAGIVVAGCLLGAAYALKLWFFGARYAEFPSLLSLLIIKFILWSTYAIGGAALVGIGAIKTGSYIAALTTALAFAVSYPLIDRFGVWGAAGAQVIVALITFLLIWWVIRGELQQLQQRHGAAQGRSESSCP